VLAPRGLTHTSLFTRRQPLSAQAHKVAVLGAAGGIGQPLSLLLKMAPGGAISRLALYDLAPVTPGVAGERGVPRATSLHPGSRAPRRRSTPPSFFFSRACLRQPTARTSPPRRWSPGTRAPPSSRRRWVRGARRAAPRFHAALRTRVLPARSLATAPRRLSRHAEGSTVVVIPAGVPRKPGMSRDDLFATNAGIVATLVDACAKYCPKVRGAPRRSGTQ